MKIKRRDKAKSDVLIIALVVFLVRVETYNSKRRKEKIQFKKDLTGKIHDRDSCTYFAITSTSNI